MIMLGLAPFFNQSRTHLLARLPHDSLNGTQSRIVFLFSIKYFLKTTQTLLIKIRKISPRVGEGPGLETQGSVT